jgi:hypothetical protein
MTLKELREKIVDSFWEVYVFWMDIVKGVIEASKIIVVLMLGLIVLYLLIIAFTSGSLFKILEETVTINRDIITTMKGEQYDFQVGRIVDFEVGNGGNFWDSRPTCKVTLDALNMGVKNVTVVLHSACCNSLIVDTCLYGNTQKSGFCYVNICGKFREGAL